MIGVMVPSSFAQNPYDIAICHKYNNDGSCQSGTAYMHLDEYYETRNQQNMIMKISQVIGIIIVIGLVITGIILIKKRLKKQEQIKKKNYQNNIKFHEKQLEYEKKEWIKKQEQENELKNLRDKVEALEKNHKKTYQNEDNQNKTYSKKISELSIEELERKIREENNEN